MKIVRYGIFFTATALTGAIAVVHPKWISENTFVQSFVGADLLSVLVVVLTITFASVANIHLSLNRFTARGSPATRQGVADIRAEINSNAWLIYSAFVVCVISLLAKGAFQGNATGLAITDAICLLVLLVNALVMHDLYHAIFALASADVYHTAKGGENDQTDYIEDSPRAG